MEKQEIGTNLVMYAKKKPGTIVAISIAVVNCEIDVRTKRPIYDLENIMNAGITMYIKNLGELYNKKEIAVKKLSNTVINGVFNICILKDNSGIGLNTAEGIIPVIPGKGNKCLQILDEMERGDINVMALEVLDNKNRAVRASYIYQRSTKSLLLDHIAVVSSDGSQTTILY